jgi:hypothetical protein
MERARNTDFESADQCDLAIAGNIVGLPLLPEVKVSDKTFKKILEFAADNITLEWPAANAATDLSECLESEYFFC